MKEKVAFLVRRLRLGASGLGNAHKAAVLMVVAFVAAAFLAVFAASAAVRWIEHVLERDTSAALAEQGLDWAEVSSDGLLLTLRGEAANEAARFRALSTVSTVVPTARR